MNPTKGTSMIKTVPMTYAQRATVAGRARQASMTPAQRTEAGRAAAAAAHRPDALARRIVRMWPGLADDERDEVRRIFGEADGLMP
jgi:hypothetical protein